MSKHKFSLTLISSGFMFLFLIIISLGIFLWINFFTEKIIDYNIKEYFKQTINLSNIIIKNEKSNLDYMSFEISETIEELPLEEEILDERFGNLAFLEQVDLLYIKKQNKILDFSSSLFDTQKIIDLIGEQKIDNKQFFLINGEDKSYLILLHSRPLIDKDTGRVKAKLFIGKIINDDFSIINKIKQNASLVDVLIFSNGNLIASTSNKKVIDIKEFKDKQIIKKDEKIHFKQKRVIDDKNSMDFIFITNNSTVSILKEDFKNKAILLFLFIIVIFVLLYLITNKYLIKPFSKILNFAEKAKDNELVFYEQSRVLEFDNFALNLKSIIDELRDLKEQYSRAIDGVQDGLWDLDLVSGKSFYSNRYLEMLGYKDLSEINIKDFWKKSIHKEDYKNTLRKLSKHLKGETSFYEDNYRFKCKDGTYKWLKIRGKVFFDIEGKPSRMTGFHTDIDHMIKLQDDNQRKEQMIYQQSKLAAMGEMIGNIAHQWRQPLNLISTIASSQAMQIELNLTKKEETLKDLSKIVQKVQYLSTIIDKFRNFFNPNKELEIFDIEDVIQDNIQIFETSYKSYNIELITKLKKVEVEGYKFELMQVVINLINNAKDALQNFYTNSEDKKYIFLENHVSNNKAIIRIYDNAGGIKKSIKDRIYEPYFTTKHKSQGTGLGLYMSSEIIKKHFKGQLLNETIKYEYEGKKYKGEEFKIEIPLKIKKD